MLLLQHMMIAAVPVRSRGAAVVDVVRTLVYAINL
jgi:hypothetical protein